MIELAKKPVYVEWVDSQSRHGWQEPNLSLHDDMLCVTLGFLVWESTAAISITDTIAETGQAHDVITIPKCSITLIQEIAWQ